MAFNGIAEHGFQFFEGVRLRKNGMAEGMGFVAAFWRLLDRENNLGLRCGWHDLMIISGIAGILGNSVCGCVGREGFTTEDTEVGAQSARRVGRRSGSERRKRKKKEGFLADAARNDGCLLGGWSGE
jgi:hypothetical protein